MRYVVNQRGRKLNPLPDQEAEKLLARGFIEITPSQWGSKDYFPEFDTGSQNQVAPIAQTPVTSSPTKKERTIFTTVIV